MMARNIYGRPGKFVLLLCVLVPLLLGWVYQDTNGIEAAYQEGVARVDAGQYAIGLGLLDFYLENTPEGDKHASASYYKAKAYKGLKEAAKAKEIMKMIIAAYPSSMEAALCKCEMGP